MDNYSDAKVITLNLFYKSYDKKNWGMLIYTNIPHSPNLYTSIPTNPPTYSRDFWFIA